MKKHPESGRTTTSLPTTARKNTHKYSDIDEVGYVQLSLAIANAEEEVFIK